jgi:hypothetical protein
VATVAKILLAGAVEYVEEDVPSRDDPLLAERVLDLCRGYSQDKRPVSALMKRKKENKNTKDKKGKKENNRRVRLIDHPEREPLRQRRSAQKTTMRRREQLVRLSSYCKKENHSPTFRRRCRPRDTS